MSSSDPLLSSKSARNCASVSAEPSEPPWFTTIARMNAATDANAAIATGSACSRSRARIASGARALAVPGARFGPGPGALESLLCGREVGHLPLPELPALVEEELGQRALDHLVGHPLRDVEITGPNRDVVERDDSEQLVPCTTGSRRTRCWTIRAAASSRPITGSAVTRGVETWSPIGSAPSRSMRRSGSRGPGP